MNSVREAVIESYQKYGKDEDIESCDENGMTDSIVSEDISFSDDMNLADDTDDIEEDSEYDIDDSSEDDIIDDSDLDK